MYSVLENILTTFEKRHPVKVSPYLSTMEIPITQTMTFEQMFYRTGRQLNGIGNSNIQFPIYFRDYGSTYNVTEQYTIAGGTTDTRSRAHVVTEGLDSQGRTKYVWYENETERRLRSLVLPQSSSSTVNWTKNIYDIGSEEIIICDTASDVTYQNWGVLRSVYCRGNKVNLPFLICRTKYSALWKSGLDYFIIDLPAQSSIFAVGYDNNGNYATSSVYESLGIEPSDSGTLSYLIERLGEAFLAANYPRDIAVSTLDACVYGNLLALDRSINE